MEKLALYFLPISIWFQNLGDGLVLPMKLITFLGNEEFYLFIMPAIYWCFDSSLGIQIGFLLLLSGSVNSLAKIIFQSPRPFWISPKIKGYLTPSSFGFPSGHAQNASSLWGYAGMKINKPGVRLTFLAVIVLIGISRLVLGVHFLHDVLAGWLIGALILFLYLRGSDRFLPWFKTQHYRFQILFIFFATLVLIVLGLFLVSPLAARTLPRDWLKQMGSLTEPYSLKDLYSISGTLFGLGSGAILLSLGGFTIQKGTWKQKVIRYLLGLSGVFILWAGLGALFPEGNSPGAMTLRYFRYTLIGFWISFGAPFIFIKTKLYQE